MRLLKASYRNFCQLRDVDVEFHPELNCIVGPNGAGKSNTLNGIVAALTNDFSRNSGVKESNVNYAAKPGDTAGVSLAFEHNGEPVLIERLLRPSKQKLVVGGKTVFKDSEIRKELFDLLGVSDQTLMKYVFVAQGEIFDFVKMKDAERADAFHQLFGVDRLKKVYDKLADVRIDVPAVTGDVESLSREIASIQGELESIERDTAAITSVDRDWNYQSDPAFLVIESYRERETLKSSVANLRAAAIQDRQKKDKLTAEADTLAGELALLDAASESYKRNFPKDQETLELWKQYNANAANLARLKTAIATTESTLADLCVPTYRPVDFDEPASVRFRIEMTNKEIESLNRKAKAVAGTYECSSCGSVLVVDEEDRFAAREKIAELSGQLIALDYLYKQCVCYDREESIRTNRLRTESDRLAWLKKDLDAFAAVSAPAEPEEVVRARLVEHHRRENEALKIRSQVESLRARASGLNPDAFEDLANKEQARLDKLGVEQDVDTARNTLARKQNDFLVLCNLHDRKKFLEQQLFTRKEQLEACLATSKQADHAKKANDTIAEVRKVFHWDNLPRLVTQSYLATLKKDMNETLDLFESGMRADILSNLQFEVKFDNGNVQPVNRLSWGQKTVFALAFRIAVNSAFAGDLGLLCLDEPTAGLDERSLLCLEKAVRKLRELSAASGLQVVIVTHEKAISSLFDHVIELPGS
jgi:DNA repair exonuclease SbcCD ATPase subunit